MENEEEMTTAQRVRRAGLATVAALVIGGSGVVVGNGAKGKAGGIAGTF